MLLLYLLHLLHSPLTSPQALRALAAKTNRKQAKAAAIEEAAVAVKQESSAADWVLGWGAGRVMGCTSGVVGGASGVVLRG